MFQRVVTGRFKIVLSLEATFDYVKQYVSLHNLSDLEWILSFRSVLFSAHAFYLVHIYLIWKDLGIWCVYIFVTCRVSVHAQEDCTKMDIEVRQGLRWQLCLSSLIANVLVWLQDIGTWGTFFKQVLFDTSPATGKTKLFL